MKQIVFVQQLRALSNTKRFIFVILYILYLTGFIYNIRHNPNSYLTKAWIYDYFALAYTNILGIPLLVWGLFSGSNKLVSKFQDRLEFKFAIYTPIIFILLIIYGAICNKFIDSIFRLLAWLGK
jgi:hypothetical protein